jgi:hypothetical protein
MKVVQFRRWKVEADPDATRLAFSRYPGNSCTCDYCGNFRALGAEAYPAEVRALLNNLGVDPLKAAEVVHFCRRPTGKHFYKPWFHFIGRIEGGRDAAVESPKGGRNWDLEAIAEGCSLGFTARADLLPKAFVGNPIVQIEIQVEVPWVLPSQDPEDPD